MAVLALLLAVIAIVVFLWGARWVAPTRPWYNHLGVGLALLTAAWIVQVLALGPFVHVN